MEKFKFKKELKEAVLIQEGGQLYAVVDGKKRKIRCPVSLKVDSIEERGTACLITEESGSNETVDKIEAMLFDDLRREGKDWVCVDPMLMERAVGYFLENHKMEKMVSGYRSVIMGKGNEPLRTDFLLDEVCAIEVKVPPVGVDLSCGSYTNLRSMVKSFERFQKRIAEHATEQNEIQKIIILIILPYRGDGSLQLALNRKTKQGLKAVSTQGIKVEFWSACMEIDKSGIGLLYYDDVTELILRE